MSWKSVTVALAVAFVMACADDVIDREEWQKMPVDDRQIYVQTLIGEANTKHAKGGFAPAYPGPINEYAASIDAAYARGDDRPVHEIFAELGTKR